MTRAELVEQLANQSNLTLKQANALLNTMQELFANVIQRGDTLKLPGFITLGTKARAARTARNPQTGAAIQIPAQIVAYIKLGSKLKAAVIDNKLKPSVTKKQ